MRSASSTPPASAPCGSTCAAAACSMSTSRCACTTSPAGTPRSTRRICRQHEDALRALPRLCVDHLGMNPDGLAVAARLGAMVKATPRHVGRSRRPGAGARCCSAPTCPAPARRGGSNLPICRRLPWRPTPARGIGYRHELRHPPRRQVRAHDARRHPRRDRRPRTVVQPDRSPRSTTPSCGSASSRATSTSTSTTRTTSSSSCWRHAADRLRGPRDGHAEAARGLHGAERRGPPDACARAHGDPHGREGGRRAHRRLGPTCRRSSPR